MSLCELCDYVFNLFCFNQILFCDYQNVFDLTMSILFYGQAL